MDQISAFQAVTLALALVGTVLGIINTWHSIDKARVKLRVRPAHAIPFGNADPDLRVLIEVTNLSAIAVTVSDVGFYYRGSTNRATVITPFLLDRGPWPRRLEPRSSVTVASQMPDSPPGLKIRCAYAHTQCGVVVTGNSPALKQIADQLAC